MKNGTANNFNGPPSQTGYNAPAHHKYKPQDNT